MKKILILILTATCIMIFGLSSCKKSYITGGTQEDVNMYKNISTYDLLKQSALYDTLLQVIDAAGIKDKINAQGNTFFAPSDYSIYAYLAKRTLVVQASNQYAKWGLDSLLYYVTNNVNSTRDSLLMYLIPQTLSYSTLTKTGAYYQTQLTGEKVIVSYEDTKDQSLGYNPIVSSFPRIVYFTHLWYPYTLNDANPASDITSDIGVRTLVKTSGIQTQNGIMNALDNSHVLFFYGTKQ